MSIFFGNPKKRKRMGFQLYDFRSAISKGSVRDFIRAVDKYEGNDLPEFVNRVHIIDKYEETTLLINATLYDCLDIIKVMFKRFNINVDTPVKGYYCGIDFDKANALWLAARLGYLGIVKFLISKNANINLLANSNIRTMNTTPLQIAAIFVHVEIAEYLVVNGADVNMTNKNMDTALMMASSCGNSDIVHYLLGNGADVNLQNKDGDTALHKAAENGQNTHRLCAKSLVAYNIQILKNALSLTPIMVAAERTHETFVNYLSTVINLTCYEEYQAKQLLGTSFFNIDKNNPIEGFFILLQAMKRYYRQPVEAYEVECQNLAEWMKLSDNVERLSLQALLIRERILGKKSPLLLPSLVHRAEVYLERKSFDRSLKLLNYALNIVETNRWSIQPLLRHFIRVFDSMIMNDALISLLDLKNILLGATDLLDNDKNKRLPLDSVKVKNREMKNYDKYIMIMMHLITHTSMALKLHPTDDPLVPDLMKIIIRLSKLRLRTRNKDTFLHLALVFFANQRSDYSLIKLLLFCGADVNARDIGLNTPLHVIGNFLLDPSFNEHNQEKKSEALDIVKELLNAGAHTDFVNKKGVCPHTSFLTSFFPSLFNSPRSLKCLSSHVVKKEIPKAVYSHQLPVTLKDFVAFH